MAARSDSRALPALLALGIACGGPLAGCGGGSPAPDGSPPAAAGSPAAAASPSDAEPAPPAFEEALPEALRRLLSKPFTGDFDEMVKRRLVRLGVTYNRTFYFVDYGVQRGAAYEYGRLFEDELNKKLKTGNLRISVAFVVLPRDLLLPALQQGRIDAVVAQVPVTAETQAVVDFSIPTRKNVSQVVITGPGVAPVATAAELSGKEVFVRKTSPYYRRLKAFNAELAAQGKPPVLVQEMSDNLEDDDILEMVNAGLIPITVVDDYLATFWRQMFEGLTVNEGATLGTGGELAVAFRKGSPKLKQALDEFLGKHGIGSAFSNMTEKRYLVNTKFARSAASEEGRKRLQSVIALFQKYAGQYEIDYLLMGAQAYQESGLDHSVRSPAGAIGIMQVMPATGRELKVGDITKLENNIHAGVKYVRFMMDKYYKDEPMDTLNKALFTFASYNAGPARIRGLRKEAEKRGLDPNVWFGNVELVASEKIGRETVTYVSNIYKYYVAYGLVVRERERREAAKAGARDAALPAGTP